MIEYLAVDSGTDSDEEEEKEGDEETFSFKIDRSVCSVTSGNRDLGAIVNGFPGNVS